MANLLDYLAWRGDLPLAAVPLCDVDALIFARLSYVPFDGIAEARVPLYMAARQVLASVQLSDAPRACGKEDQQLLTQLLQSPRYADILLANKDGSRECLVECQGKAIHGSIESKISDSDRTTALQTMGYPVVLMTYGQLVDSDAFRVVMELIMSYLDMPLKDKTPRQQELERRLREEIFIDWAGM